MRKCFAFETLEPRLALTWAGVPPVTISPPANAVPFILNSQNSGSGSASIATTEVDYYSFVATGSGTYTISAATPSSNLDTVLGVFSASGQRLAYNDDIVFAQNTDSRLTINLTAGTRYYIGITNYATNSRGAYNWSVIGPAATTRPTDDSYENNDTRATAANLGTPTTTQTINSLVMADSADWYQFTTTATGTSSSSVSISFQNSQGNLQLGLYNSLGTLVASSTGSGNSESVSLNGLAAGTYFIDVFGNAGALNPNYSLTVAPPTTSSTPPTSGGFQITLSMTGLTASQQTIFQQAATRWSQVITGDLPNATYRGQTVDDLLINASSVSIDGVGGILGQSGPDAFRSATDLPYHGIMQFDSADMASMQQQGLLYSVVLHEIGHILGIGTIWEDLGLLSGAGTNNPIFTGAQATAAYNQLFGTSARGVPVEATGGAGTADSHWRESVFTNELMTGWAGPGSNLPLSTVTIASLADLGYTVNFAAADPWTPSAAVRSLVSGGSIGSASSLRANSELAAAMASSVNSVTAMQTASTSHSALLALEVPAVVAKSADSAETDPATDVLRTARRNFDSTEDVGSSTAAIDDYFASLASNQMLTALV